MANMLEQILLKKQNPDNLIVDGIAYDKSSDKDLSHIDKFLKIISNNNRLIITYDPKAKTARFTPATNTVTLPTYITKDRDLYLLMGSHEISHVLHTPLEFLDKHDGNSNDLRVKGIKLNKLLMNCINIVEDIRIERLIRNKFPGFVSTYERGYKKLLDSLFQIDDKRWNESHLGDRINAKAKLGKQLIYNLTTYEEGIYRYLKDTKDFNDVLIKSLYLYNILVEDKKDNQQEQKEQAEEECEAEGDNKNASPDAEYNNPKDSSNSDNESESDSSNSDNESESDSNSSNDSSSDNSNEAPDSPLPPSIEDIIKKLEESFSANINDDFSTKLLEAISEIADEMLEINPNDMDKLSENMMDLAKDEYITENSNAKNNNFNPHYITKYKDIITKPQSIMKKIF